MNKNEQLIDALGELWAYHPEMSLLGLISDLSMGYAKKDLPETEDSFLLERAEAALDMLRGPLW